MFIPKRELYKASSRACRESHCKAPFSNLLLISSTTYLRVCSYSDESLKKPYTFGFEYPIYTGWICVVVQDIRNFFPLVSQDLSMVRKIVAWPYPLPWCRRGEPLRRLR